MIAISYVNDCNLIQVHGNPFVPAHCTKWWLHPCGPNSSICCCSTVCRGRTDTTERAGVCSLSPPNPSLAVLFRSGSTGAKVAVAGAAGTRAVAGAGAAPNIPGAGAAPNIPPKAGAAAGAAGAAACSVKRSSNNTASRRPRPAAYAQAGYVTVSGDRAGGGGRHGVSTESTGANVDGRTGEPEWPEEGNQVVHSAGLCAAGPRQQRGAGAPRNARTLQHVWLPAPHRWTE